MLPTGMKEIIFKNQKPLAGLMAWTNNVFPRIKKSGFQVKKRNLEALEKPQVKTLSDGFPTHLVRTYGNHSIWISTIQYVDRTGFKPVSNGSHPFIIIWLYYRPINLINFNHQDLWGQYC